MLSYDCAISTAAALCNHNCALPKSNNFFMANLQAKISAKIAAVEKAEKDYKQLWESGGAEAEQQEALVKRLLEQLNRLEMQRTHKEENKQVSYSSIS